MKNTKTKKNKTAKSSKRSIDLYDEDREDEELVDSLEEDGYSEDISYYKSIYNSMRDW